MAETEGVRPPEFRNELSGTVVGPSIQARSIEGVHFHLPPTVIKPVPHQVPAAPAHFTGRTDELAWLDRLADRGSSSIAVLCGPGGVGKSALARTWGQQVGHRFPDGQLYADLGGFGGGEPADPGEVLGMFLRALGVPAPEVPSALAEQTKLYRSLTAGRSMLVVLDDGFSAAQVKVLVPGPSASMVVVTSRSRLSGLVTEGAQVLEVALMSTADSVTLLTRAVGTDRIEREPDSATRLAGLCSGLPLALCVTAARLVNRPRLSVERLAEELVDETARLGGMSSVDVGSLSATFDLSYRSLDPPAAILYRRLALHPGPDFGPGPAAVALLCFEGARRTEPPDRVIEALLGAHLLQEIEEGRFAFHDLLRLHAKQKAETDDTAHDRDSVLVRTAQWYWCAAARADLILTPYRRKRRYTPLIPGELLPDMADRKAALGWLERERVNLVAVGRAAMAHGHYELTWHLCDVLWPLHLLHKHYADRLEVNRRGIEAAQAWGDGWAEARMQLRCGRTLATMGGYQEAEPHLHRAVALYRAAEDCRGVTDAEEALAVLHRESGRTEQAVEWFRRVLAANRRLGDDRCLGLALINLGALLAKLDRGTEALDLLREARAVFAGLSGVDPYNEARAGIALAHAHLRIGDLSGAEAAAVDAADRMQQLDSQFERAEALCLLGDIAQRRGDGGAAGRHYRAALDAFTHVGSTRADQVRTRLARLLER